MLIRTTKVKIAETVTIDLPNYSEILGFIKQGTLGVFLWYVDSSAETTRPIVFHFMRKGQYVDPNWKYLQNIKDGSYYQVFYE